MSKSFTVEIIEQCKVTPPPKTTPTNSLLPLTFLDLPWLFFSPSQPLFFYEFPHPISHFTTTTVPNLKHSLSLTLQHYYPFAGTFVPSLEEPKFAFTSNNSSVSLEIAASNGGDFEHLCSSNQPRDANDFHLLVPKLASSLPRGEEQLPLLAVQVTVFPNAGICIGFAFHQVVADGRTFDNFFKTWASYCCFGASSVPLPFYDRSVIVDAKGLEQVFLKEWRRRPELVQDIANGREAKVDLSSSSMVRATFLMGATEMEKIKGWIVNSCKEKNEPQPVHLSAYVLTCAFLWVCLVKAQQSVNEKITAHKIEEPTYFGFIAGGITRLDFPVPKTYLGNCVGLGRASVRTRELLLGEDGIVVAATAIGSTIKKLDDSLFAEAEDWILDWDVLLDRSERHVYATWSPKLRLYESDFGWGRPKKIEEITIDSTRAVSLVQSRDVEGGIEIGLSLPKNRMSAFSILFNEGLNALSS